MAWRSSGTTNDEMVDNLKRFGVISTPEVEEAFREVDRAFFIPPNLRDMAHTDQPLREGHLHISAPHIYGSVLEALELKPNSSLSFLNVGSGTGYMSCIVASILGCHSNNYGVEIYEDVVQHSKRSMERWKNSVQKKVPEIEWIHGNALHINPKKGESLVGFDRIYVGASVDKEDVTKLTHLLRPGGILVGPVEAELVKIVRVGHRTNRTDSSSSSRVETDETNELSPLEFSQQVLSDVRFAPLLENPRISTVLPSKVWDPSVHYSYPDSFRHSCREILLCSHASHVQEPAPVQVRPKETVNAAGLLPRVLWMEILSYTHRDWFEKPESEVDFLRRRLQEEQEYAKRAHQARMDAEYRLHLVEEERDVYRVLARRYQLRLESDLQRSGRTSRSNDEIDEDDAGEESEEEQSIMVPLSGREQAVIFGLGAMLRSIHYDSGDDDDDDEVVEAEEEDGDDDADAESENQGLGGSAPMEEDSSHGGHDEAMSEQDTENLAERSTYFPLGSETMAAEMIVRPQIRTVSITSEDL